MLCFCLRDVVILQLHPIYRVHSGWVVLQLDCSKGGFFSSHGFILVVGLSAAVVLANVGTLGLSEHCHFLVDC